MKFCCDCKYWKYNEESEEEQCFRMDSDNLGIPMDELDICQAFVNRGQGKVGFESIYE